MTSRASVVLRALSMMLVAQQLAPALGDAQQDQVALDSLSVSNFRFTNSIYQELSKESGNIIFSPLSIHSILTMTSLGAKSLTAEQMRQGLHLSDTTNTALGYKQLHEVFKSANSDSMSLNLANKIYLKKGIVLHPEFLRQSRDVFDSETEGVDFTTDAADKINQWVEEKTNHMIKDLVERESLDASTAMVLVNAVHFKARWQKTFYEGETALKPFHVSDSKSVSVPIMEATEYFNYYQAEDSLTQVLEMPYEGYKASLIILLPHTRNGLAQLEQEISQKGLPGFINNLTGARVTVSLPKFRIEQSAQLVEILKKLGMTDMFEPSADFSGLVSDGQTLQVSDVAHKAIIDVDESGTEAAAATYMQMVFISDVEIVDLEDPLIFNADHPFVFILYHKQTEQVLFMGRFVTPE